MGRKIYPSDISRDQFELIQDMLENAKHQTAPRKVDLYDVFCAILYLLKNGCTWRAIPGDFPRWTTVRYYFDQWTASTADGFSVLEQSLKKSGQARASREWARRKDDVLHCFLLFNMISATKRALNVIIDWFSCYFSMCHVTFGGFVSRAGLRSRTAEREKLYPTFSRLISPGPPYIQGLTHGIATVSLACR